MQPTGFIVGDVVGAMPKQCTREGCHWLGSVRKLQNGASYAARSTRTSFAPLRRCRAAHLSMEAAAQETQCTGSHEIADSATDSLTAVKQATRQCLAAGICVV